MTCTFLSPCSFVKGTFLVRRKDKVRFCTTKKIQSDFHFVVFRRFRSQSRFVVVATQRGRVHDYAKLSKKDFDELLKKNELRICLLGMSNCGKTLRSIQLAQHYGFERFCVDDKIEQQISSILQRNGYSSGIEGVAKWMGYPFEERFYQNQKIYLDYENQLTYKAAQIALEVRGSFVLDTTGSVIYLEKKTLDVIRNTFLLVHLEASEDILQEMIRLYFEAPKPVIWGESFKPLPNEDGLTALKRCYPQLLRYRLKRYQQCAHCSVPASVSMNSELPVEMFMEKIRECLIDQ